MKILKNLICTLFHKKDHIEFRSQNWVRRCIYENNYYSAKKHLFEKHKVECLCLKCGRSFYKKTCVTFDEAEIAWIINTGLKTRSLKESVRIEEMFYYAPISKIL